MRERMRRQYYCDFCKKSGAAKWAMALHESHCTMNPARTCRMCALAQNGQPPLVATRIAVVHEGVDALRKACEGCPACMLAAIRQDTTNSSYAWHDAFDYKKEVQDLFNLLNSDRDESGYAY